MGPRFSCADCRKCFCRAYALRTRLQLNLEHGADQFTPPPYEAASVGGCEIVPSHFELYRKYRLPMCAKSHTAIRDIDYPDAAHTLTVVKEEKASAAGNTCPCE
jgi:hypothetical protein